MDKLKEEERTKKRSLIPFSTNEIRYKIKREAFCKNKCDQIIGCTNNFSDSQFDKFDNLRIERRPGEM